MGEGVYKGTAHSLYLMYTLFNAEKNKSLADMRYKSTGSVYTCALKSLWSNAAGKKSHVEYIDSHGKSVPAPA